MFLPLGEEEIEELYNDEGFYEAVCEEDEVSEYEGAEYENE